MTSTSMDTAHPTTTTTAGPPPPVSGKRPPFARLTAVEVRKAVDTRSGRALLAVFGVLTAVELGGRVDSGDAFGEVLGAPLLGPALVLPALGVLAMTGEWTQRTALTTFALVPQRGRVLAARLIAAVLLAVATVLLVAAATAATLVAVGVVGGAAVTWGDVPGALAGVVTSSVLDLLMGAAFGALLQQTAPALVLYFVAPVVWAVAGGPLLGDGARWLDVNAAINALSSFSLGGVVGPTLVAVGMWVVLPLAAGIARALRRDVS